MKYKQNNTDVLVAGGGMAGFVAAVSAARKGCNVTIIDKMGCLGGVATSGMMSEIIAMHLDDKVVVPEISVEIMRRMIEKGAGRCWGNVSTSVDEDVKTDRFRYNSEYLKIILDDMAQEAGVKVYFCCDINKAEEIPEGVRVTLTNTFETIHIDTKVLIDATGNASCIYMLDEKSTIVSPKEKRQAVSTIFKLGGVDVDTFVNNLTFGEVQRIIKAGKEVGAFPSKVCGMSPVAGTDQIAFNCTRCNNIDHESMEDISHAIMETRKQIDAIVTFLKETVSGCKNAYLSSIASSLGVRDRRKIAGLYQLTGEDVIHARKFNDAVAIGVYPVDIHIPKDGKDIQFIKIKGNGIYKIPYKCMVTQRLDNVIAAGKCIDGDDVAFGAFRAMGCIQCIGNAAGTAAFLAVKHNIGVKEIDINELQAHVRKDGVIDI